MGTRVVVAMVAMVVVMVLVIMGYAAGYPLMPGDDYRHPAIAAQTGDGADPSLYTVGIPDETYP